MKKIFLLIAGCVWSAGSVMAADYSSLWKVITGPVASANQPVLQPTVYRAFAGNEQVLHDMLAGITIDPAAAPVIDLPTPDGSFRAFRIWQTPVMEEGLATRYAGIYTFTATAVDNHMVTAKIDYTPYGLHALVFDGANTFLVDPYSNVADGNYISYYKHDYPRPAVTMACGVHSDADNELVKDASSLTGSGLPELQYKLNGTIKRKFRLALACTGEYAVAVAGSNPTKAAVLAKMVTSINRVNGVYERELAYTLILIQNTDNLIYLNGTTDPYSNNNGGVMLDENQNNVTSVIGSASYDIGHVFSTGGGGIATRACVCKSNSKAEGVTGSTNPVGDAYDIDYVAHEMGHQFGADHTFNNNNSGSCSGNAVSAYAYEPGSGSTIMAYAGICGGGNDFQQHSDDYFHSASMEQITSYINTTTCAVTEVSSNTNAVVVPFAATYSIPFLTPFELTAPVATDLNADTLTYCWEERDRGDFGKSLALTRLTGPMFRSFAPVTTPTRIFPRIQSILSNTLTNNAEKVADTSRVLRFKLTERDIYQGFGCFNIPDDTVKLNVIYTGVGFTVTSPNTNVTWTANGTQTVTWDVASTTAFPISCANVDIYVSTDGGFTFPFLVKSNTPNDGSEAITVPNANTTKMRVKVKGAGNVFFAISTINGSIQGGTAVANTNLNALDVVVSPVPAQDKISIRVKNSTEALQGRIVTAVGQTIWSGTIRDQQDIQVDAWPRGVYYLQLMNSAGTAHMNQTLVVQ